MRDFLTKCDPRVKLVLAFLFSVTVAISSSWNYLLGVSFLVLSWTILSPFRVGEIIQKLAPANLFLGFVALTLPFTTPGQVVYHFGPLKATKQGLDLAFFIFCKSNLILWGDLVLLNSSSIFALAHALHHLRLPNKLVQLLFFTFRYLELLKREYRRLREAALLRAFVPRTNFHTYRTLAYFVGCLFVRSYDRSQRIYEAMLCRGFNGVFPVYRHFYLQKKDLFFGLSSVLALLALVLLTHLH